MDIEQDLDRYSGYLLAYHLRRNEAIGIKGATITDLIEDYVRLKQEKQVNVAIGQLMVNSYKILIETKKLELKGIIEEARKPETSLERKRELLNLAISLQRELESGE